MYTTWKYFTKALGNNAFSYVQRKALWSQTKIFVTNLIQGNREDLKQWSEIVFEEIDHNQLKSCTGLQHFIHTQYQSIPVYIVDNHNHVLSFRYQQSKNSMDPQDAKPYKVIHIDQHADTKPNTENIITEAGEDIETFIHEKTNVGNFISAALHNNIIDEVIQIRSGYALHHMQPLDFLQYNYILDIDIDFWEDKSATERASDIIIIHELIKNVCLITIATSPFFIDQSQAIRIAKQILQ